MATRLRADQRLFLSYLLLISLLVVSLSLGADSVVRRQLTRTVGDDLQRELELGIALYDAAPGVRPDSVARLLAGRSGRRVTILSRDGRVLGESGVPADSLTALVNHRNRPEVREALERGRGEAVRYSTTLEQRHLYAAGVSRRGEVVRFAVALRDVDRIVGGIQRGIVLIGGLALLVAAVFSLGFSVAVTRPLRRIGAVARAMAAGDLTRRLRERRDDELGDLAAALDSLADELQRRLGQLEDERAEMQALIDAMSEAVLALSPDGAVRRANPAARRVFALPADPRGLPPEAVTRRPEFLRLVGRALRGETVPPTPVDADDRHLLATAHPLPGGGAVLVFLDVSQLRRLEDVRRDFVANASHELKTPLTAIRGYSETLLDDTLPPELRRTFTETVRANAERLQRIVDDLLDLSRIESGGWRVEPTDLHLPDVVGEACAAVEGEAARRGVELVARLDRGCDRVHADAAALQQILVNLLGNAIRYTPAGGRVEVRCAPADPPARTPAAPRGWVRIEVADTGVGIPPAHLGRIFERFYRVDPARSRAEGGTGLGLAIVRHLVEAHGGRVSARSQVGAGTTLAFTLPAPDAA